MELTLALVFSLITLATVYTYLIYSALLEGLLSATIGKLILGLEIKYDVGEEEISSQRQIQLAFRRAVGKFLTILTLGLGFFVPMLCQKRQALHDKIARSCIVQVQEQNNLRKFFGYFLTICFIVITICFLLMPGIKSIKRFYQPIILPPVTNPIPETQKSSYLKIGEERKELNYFYLRLFKPSELGDNDEVVISSKNRIKIEILAFANRPEFSEESKLDFIPELIVDTKKILKNLPSLIMSTEISADSKNCGSSKFLNSEVFLYYGNKYVNITKGSSSLTSPDPHHSINLSCINININETVAMLLKGYWYDEKDLKVEWYINSSSNFSSFKYLKSKVFSSFQDVVALWFAAKNHLEIGFYPDKLGITDLSKIQETGNLHTVAIQPDSIASLKLTPNSGMVTRDSVKDGYKLIFNGASTGTDAPLSAQNKIEIIFEPGKSPSTFAGSMKNNSRLIGRFEGEKKIESSDGIAKFKWIMPFNAQVIVAGTK